MGSARFLLRVLAVLLACMPAARAQVSVSSLQPLSFGDFANLGGGSVSVAPTGGRSATPAITLIPSQTGAQAILRVTDPSFATNQIFSISLPADDEVKLSNGSGGLMPLRGFASQPAGFAMITSSAGTLVQIGATLVVGLGQAAGAYSGSFEVTVNYQ